MLEDIYYVGTLALALLGGVLIPILFFRFERSEQNKRDMHEENKALRHEEFSNMAMRLDHLDACLDSVRARIVSTTEIAALAERVFRLENIMLKGAD